MRTVSKAARMALGTATAVAIFSFPAASRAAVTSTYDPQSCRGVTESDEAALSRATPGLLTSTRYSALTNIVCPISKTTSGPSALSGDAITNITVHGGMGWMSCTASVFEVNPEGLPSVSNLKLKTGPVSAANETVTISLSLSGISGYWQTGNKWRYAELACSISGGTNFSGYSVTEQGVAQSPNRIVSAATCRPSTSSSSSYMYLPDVSTGSWGGYVEALHQTPGTYFSATCPTSSGPGNYVQMALGPNISSTSNLMGCGVSGSSATWQYVPKHALGGDFPPELLTFPLYSSNLVCEPKNHPSDGDSKIFSYRTATAQDFASDPTCAGGLVSGNSCCAAGCGTCGGTGCGARPGGGAACCTGVIATSNTYCVDHGAPCIMADPHCKTGILSGNVCCAASCGTCGGNGCSGRPGGGAACCGGPITAAGNSCATHMPPCIVN